MDCKKENPKFIITSEIFFKLPEGYYPPQVAMEVTETDEDPSQTIDYCIGLSKDETASIEAREVAEKVLKLKHAALISDTFCVWHNGPDTISAKIPCDTPAQILILMKEITK